MSDTQTPMQALEASFAPAQEAPVQAAEAPAQAPQSVDLDGLSEFSYQGEKYTPDKLHQIITEYKSLNEQKGETKYWHALQADLETIKARPDLAPKFKEQYPAKFHAYLDLVLGKGQETDQAATTQAPAIPKEVLTRIEAAEQKLSAYEQRAHQAEVEANIAKMDAILPKLYQKYELANNDQVLIRAEQHAAKGVKLTDAVWERLVRESHDQVKKAADAYYQKTLKAQIEKGQRGADVAPGGVAPGQKPIRPRTFDEAEELMMREAKAGRLNF
jgi:hypothetical protein